MSGHLEGVVRKLEQRRRDLIDPFIRALSTQKYRHKQGERILMIERYRGIGVKLIESTVNEFNALSFDRFRGMRS